MTLKEFLSFSLFDANEFNITVYELVFVLIVLISAPLFIRILKRILKTRENTKYLDEARSYTILQIAKYFIWILAIITSLQTIGIKFTLLLAGSAALLVGLGLGLQQIFQDLVSGVTILFGGVLKVSDIVEIQDGTIGKVIQVGLRTSKIETRDNIIMIIPNSKFVTDNVINWSHMEKRTRFSVAVGIAYGSDVEKVTSILLQCAKSHKEVSSKPEPFVRFKDFGESSLDFEVFFWTINTFTVESIKSDIRYKINELFIEEEIRIPFPQRDVHIKTN